MPARETALRRYFSTRPCAACQQCAAPEALLVLIRRPGAWMVMVTCGACHQRGLFTVTFPSAAATAPISYADVRAMRSFLDGFNGDFRSLFGNGPQGRFATD